MANTVTGDGSYSPNIVAGIGNTGTVSIDTGPLNADYLTAGSAMAGDGNGVITITGDNGIVNVADPGIYAYSRLLVGSGYGPYSGTGVLNVNNGGSLTSTNNAALASGSIPLGGYSNLVVGTGPNATGTVNVDGVGGFGSSILALYGGPAGFVLGADSGNGAINVTNGAQFFTLTGVAGAGDTSGGSYPGGTGTITVDGLGSEFFATTNNGDFLVDFDQAPVIFLGQNDGTGNLNVDNGGLFAVENVMGDGKSSPTLILGDDTNSVGDANVLGAGSRIEITQYGAASGGNRLNGDSGLIVGNAGIGLLDVLSGAEVNVLGDRANLVVSRGGYDAQGAPIAPPGQSLLSVYFGGQANVDSQGYGGQGGATVTVGAQRLSDGYLQVGSSGVFTVRSDTDLVDDQTTGLITVGDLGSGYLRVGSLGSVYGRELVLGARSYTAVALDNSTDQVFDGYFATPDGGGDGTAVVNSGDSKIVITGSDNSQYRGITLGQASGTTGSLTINNANSYVKSTGGAGLITIGEFGDGDVTVSGGGALYGNTIVVSEQATSSPDTVSISGVDSKVVADGFYGRILDGGGLDIGRGPSIEVGFYDGSYGVVSVTDGGELRVENDAGVDQNPRLIIGALYGAVGNIIVTGTGSPVPAISAINVIQEGARFMAPNGDVLPGAELVVGLSGTGTLTAGYNSEVNVQGDSASLIVGGGAYDGLGAPIFSSAESVFTIQNGASVLVDSGVYGFDPGQTNSMGSAAFIGDRIGGYGRIDVDGTGSSLTIDSQSDFAGDYGTASLVVGGLGRGSLNVSNNATVDARSLNIGGRSFYDDGMGGGRQYGGYLPNVTAAGSGAVTISNDADVTITAAPNTPNQGIRIARESGTDASVVVNGSGSTLTSTGGNGRISVARYGTGDLIVEDGGEVRGFFFDIGRSQGSDGDVYVDGYGSSILVSNAYGTFNDEPEFVGEAGFLRLGREDGSDGYMSITSGGRVDVINDPATGYDNPFVQIGRSNGSYGRLVVSGEYVGSGTYASTLRIAQTGPVGDYVATGGIGPYGPRLAVGQGGQGVAEVSNGGTIVLEGAAAHLSVASGRRDGGVPNTTTDTSSLTISGGSLVTVDSQSYGGTQDFTSPIAGTITANLGSQVTVGSDTDASGLITVDGAGSALVVTSSALLPDDYGNGQIRVGLNNGTGALNVSNGGAVYARGLNLGAGPGSIGDSQLTAGGVIEITGTDQTAYQGVAIGRDGGTGAMTLQGASYLISSGGAGRLQVGREGAGELNVLSASDVNAFFVEIGRGPGANGDVYINGYGSRLTASDAYGEFDPASYGPRGGLVRVGRDGGNGQVTINGGGSLNVINDSMAVPTEQGDGPILEIGRGPGANGVVTVSGDDGMGNASYVRVQNYGRSNDAYVPGEYYGPELRLGRDGANGALLIEQGGAVDVVGERAQVIIGQGVEGGDFNLSPTSLVSITTGGELLVDSAPNPDYSRPYNAAADIVIGRETGGNGRLLVSGAGSTVTIQSDNAADYYANMDLAEGAGLDVGLLGRGLLEVLDGAQITINGTDDAFPRLTVGYGQNGATIGARGYATVDGVGSRIDILGANTGVGPNFNFGTAGTIDVGVHDGSLGRLTISGGGAVANTSINTKTQIAKNPGSTGEIIVTGAGSTLDAGAVLTVGADIDLATGAILDNQSGDGTLTINSGGIVAATSAYVGSSGTLSISDASIISDLQITGGFFVGGADSQGDATVQGAFSQISGLLEFEVFGVNAGEFDTLTTSSTAIISGETITIDVGDLATLNVGDSAVLFSTTGTLNIDTTDTVTFVGQADGPGREFVLTQENDPLAPGGPVDQLVFSVQQGTLAIVTGDFEIIATADGQVALTTADVSIVEGGVDPALQTLTAANVTGGQLESALNPGVALASFSQQDVDDRLIRFVSDGTSGGSFDLGFTDSIGFADVVSIEVVKAGVPDIDVNGFTEGEALAFDGINFGAYTGYSVSGAGDVNGDGIDDLIIGASRGRGDNNDATGASFVVFGSLSPFPTDFDLTRLDGTNGFKILGENDSDDTGYSVTGVGDVNGDGVDDLAVGSPGALVQGLSAGKVHILFGDTAPVDPTISLSTLPLTEGLAIEGSDPDSQFGSSVAGGRDINNDGIADVVIGDISDGVDIGSGAAFVIFGSATGLTGPASTTALDGSNGFRITSSSAFTDDLGASVAMADIDGDGIADLIVGSPDSYFGNGGVYVIKGVDAFDAIVDINNLDGTNGFKIAGLSEYDLLGTSVSYAGDFNGDGVEDIIFGAHEEVLGGNDAVGSVYILFGVANGFNNATFDLTTIDGTNGIKIGGIDADDNFGRSVSSVGDMNGDGFDDVLIGAPTADPYGMETGQAYLIFGSDTGFAAQQAVTSLTVDQVSRITNFDVLDSGGFSTGGGFDLNGDGLDDAIVGAPNAGPTDEGGALVVFGAAAPLNPFINGDLLVEAAQGQSGVITTADLLASEPDAIPADLLYHVTNAVGGFVAAFDTPGAPIATFTQADVDGGQVVFTKDPATETGSFDVTVTDLDGDIAGPVSVAVQSPVGANSFNLSDLDGTNGFRLNGIAAGDFSGLAVSNAGDINGDGFADVIIGAEQADGGGINDSGETYIVFGAAGGFAPQVELSSLNGPNGFRLTGTAPADLSGGTVSAAGDVNNDGFDDLLVGIRNADRPSFNEGEVVVIYGGSTPFPATQALTGFDGTNGTVINGGDLNSLTGASLSEAGDINGDGIDDFIIGSPFGDTGAGADAGESYVVFGADGGLGASFDLTTLDGSNGFRVEGDASDATVGIVSGLGDINNDGFDDFAVGSQVADPASGADAGQTFVFFGGPTAPPVVSVGGLNGTNGFRVDGLAAGDQSARSLSAAGDLNNDGVDDFLISAFTTDPNGVTNAGSVYVVFGQAGGPAAGAATFDLASLDGSNGFVIEGVDPNDRTGYSISNIGDFDGDGISDILIGAEGGDPFDVTSAGEAYIVFGQEGGFDATLNLSDLDGTNGLRLNGIDAGDRAGRSVSGAGDVNNDGRDDIIIGAFDADPGGLVSAGESYVVFGFGPNQPPRAQDDDVSVAEGGAATFNVIDDNGAGIDRDIDGDSFRISGANGQAVPNGGSINFFTAAGLAVTIDSTGAVSLNAASPALDFLGEGEQFVDSFVYRLQGEFGGTDTAQVNVAITGVNDAPIAANDLLRTDDRTAITASIFADNGAGVDRDPDSAFTVTSINGDSALVGTEITLPSGALVTISANGDATFDPNGAFNTLNAGEQGTEQLTYTISDAQGATDQATVVFTVDGVTNTILGTPGNDLIRGTDEADDIDGLGGNDLITGLAGNDTIKGGPGLDIIRGGADDDVLIGGAQKDRMFGEAGDDRLDGGGGDDRLLGLAGNDTINGNAGDDVLSGGRGNDLVSGQDGDDRLRGGRDSDTLIAGDGKDRLQGGTGNDSLFGQAGNDNLTGAGGADTLSGGDGLDRLFGRRGNDELTGGQGSDRFIFNLGDGSDTITDFEQGADRIRIASGADNFADLTITQVGDDALIAFGNVRILALDEDANDFTNSDFVL